MSSIYTKMIKRITDNYNRNENSNISKMMKLAAHHIQENEELLNRIHDWRDIDQAEGVTLDYIGRNIGQDRIGFDDAAYRFLIKSRIIRNNSDGSIPSILRFVSLILGVEKKFVKIQEKWSKDNHPVGIYIEIDVDYVVAIGIPFEEFGYVVNDLLTAGIPADLYYRGSFMFSDFPDKIQEDEERGFSDFASNEFYHAGDFRLGGIEENFDEQKGLAKVEIDKGGKFGGYFKVNGFNDGTDSVLKAW
ncbi:TPA: DUF2612 domain-containing protein [Bacillus cereus]|uniref:DUF2612 domain-containing protein n=1 Tax=Bacillus cereus TaxID=1396 RepID=UPI0019263729|nr:DUF2612 domain-containing protein [Bacillus cereus]HDR8076501.1 DUF2612 domain-containing protein [Bacillus cereus]HDR8514850.1 DUF2612 domain-containing protein [Bacillus cereus]